MGDFTGMMLSSDITKCESTCTRLTMLNAKKRKMWYNNNMIYLHIKQNCSFTQALIVSTFFYVVSMVIPNCENTNA